MIFYGDGKVIYTPYEDLSFEYDEFRFKWEVSIYYSSTNGPEFDTDTFEEYGVDWLELP